jgi:hypothetical protein
LPGSPSSVSAGQQLGAKDAFSNQPLGAVLLAGREHAETVIVAAVALHDTPMLDNARQLLEAPGGVRPKRRQKTGS